MKGDHLAPSSFCFREEAFSGFFLSRSLDEIEGWEPSQRHPMARRGPTQKPLRSVYFAGKKQSHPLRTTRMLEYWEKGRDAGRLLSHGAGGDGGAGQVWAAWLGWGGGFENDVR